MGKPHPTKVRGAEVIHYGFDDLPTLSRHAHSGKERHGYYRRVRDEVRAYILTLPESLE